MHIPNAHFDAESTPDAIHERDSLQDGKRACSIRRAWGSEDSLKGDSHALSVNPPPYERQTRSSIRGQSKPNEFTHLQTAAIRLPNNPCA